MNWDALGAIAELAGAIAVVATLIYLAVQIKQSSRLVEQNNKLLDVSVANSIREAQNEVSRILASDGNAALVFWHGLDDRNALTEEQRTQFDSLMFLTFSAAQQGLVTGSEETHKSLAWTLQHLGARQWWAEYVDIFTKPMQEVVLKLIPED